MAFWHFASLARRTELFALFALLFCASPRAARAQPDESSAGCAEPPAGLIGWWRGEDDASDAVSKETASLVTASYVAGKVGRAFNFANTETTVRIAASEKRNEQTQNGFTLELWVNLRDVESGQPIVEFRSDQNVTGVHLWIYDEAGRIWGVLKDRTGTEYGIASGSGVLRAKVWQHIAFTYDRAGTGSLYLNGTLGARRDLGSFTPQLGYDIYLGGHRPGYPEDNFLRGALDEVSLYNRPLSSEEIAAIYRAGTAGKCAPGRTPVAASTRAPSSAPRATKTPQPRPTKTTKNAAASTRAASPKSWAGRCLRVLDGNTMMVRRGNKEVAVELYGVAAPKVEGQNFGLEAMQWLQSRAEGKAVTIYETARRLPTRATAWVFVGKESLNAAILRDGLAWWDSRRAPRETKLQTLMEEARSAKRGLWSKEHPTAPWAFRDEEPASSREAALQENWAKFPLMKSNPRRSDGTLSFSLLTLNENPVISEGVRYNGFRFKAEVSGAQDFAWAFVPPANAGGWQIAARRGDMKWFRSFKEYARTRFRGLENLIPRDQPKVTLQHLPGDFLTPGAEYLVWFEFSDDKPAIFSFAFTFADVDSGNMTDEGRPVDSDLLYDRVMTVLGLKRK